MWGNRLGWILAGVVALVIFGLVGIFVRLQQPTPPTDLTKDPAALAPLDLPIPPEEAWPDTASEDRDAGPAYRQVAFDWNDERQAVCQTFIQSPRGNLPSPIDLLLQSRRCKRMSLFIQDPASLINYEPHHGDLDALVSAGKTTCTIALALARANRGDDALACIEAAFNLGRNLYNERLSHDEFSDGLSLMGEAASAMQTIQQTPSLLSTQLGLFDSDRLQFEKTHIEPIWQAIDSADPMVIATHTGDIFVLAQQSRERMWRVEATLKLGRLRFDAATYGDRVTANRLIRKLVNDPDPAVAIAATAARDLTIEKYRSLGGD